MANLENGQSFLDQEATKYGVEHSQPKHTAEPLDPFVDHPVPPFPLDVLPDTFRRYAEECAAGSGFDAGAYGFSLLAASAGLIDHRVKLRAGPISVPPHLWCSLSAVSGDGKSPVIEAAAFAHYRLNDKALAESIAEYRKWAALAKEKQPKEVPPIRQMLIDNTTTEGASDALLCNPEGVIAILPELSEWIGRMDAYSGKGADKDRGVWIRAFDGGPQQINRARDPIPKLIENFSVGILAGVQPEKLLQMFQKSGAAASDGLFQRFLCYQMAEAGEVDYSHDMGMFTKANVERIIHTLAEWREDGRLKGFSLSGSALKEAEAHHNLLRKLQQRTPRGRFAEHIGKLPGLTLRICLALHVIDAAAAGVEPDAEVPLSAFEKAQAVMRTLYRHSEAAYSLIDTGGVGQAVQLAKSACEAILTRKWESFKRGDLTRHATGWQGADPRAAEAAIDLLIEWAWCFDITPKVEPGRRGRPSLGEFAVFPQVHERFAEQTERITQARAERFQAIQSLAATRVREAQLVG